jgi:MoaA/NifB/PqqE/SkfB family radical SAM enzyme
MAHSQDIAGRCNVTMTADVPSVPRRVVIEPTYACSLRCRHCYVRRSARAAGREGALGEVLPFSFWARLLKTMPSNSLIHFTGGEVLEYPGAVELIHVAAAQNRVSLITNGQNLDETTCLALQKCGPSNVTVSIHGDAEVHDRVTGVSGSHRAAVDGLRRLLRRLPPETVSVNFTLLDENIDVLPQVVASLAAIGVRRMVLQLYDRALNRAGIIAGCAIPPSDQEDAASYADRVRRGLAALRGNREMEIVIPTLPPNSASQRHDALEPDKWRCVEVQDTIRCGAQGQVYTCTGTVMGWLGRQPWNDIWNSVAFVAFRQRHRVSGACLGCCKLRANDEHGKEAGDE